MWSRVAVRGTGYFIPSQSVLAGPPQRVASDPSPMRFSDPIPASLALNCGREEGAEEALSKDKGAEASTVVSAVRRSCLEAESLVASPPSSRRGRSLTARPLDDHHCRQPVDTYDDRIETRAQSLSRSKHKPHKGTSLISGQTEADCVSESLKSRPVDFERRARTLSRASIAAEGGVTPPYKN